MRFWRYLCRKPLQSVPNHYSPSVLRLVTRSVKVYSQKSGKDFYLASVVRMWQTHCFHSQLTSTYLRRLSKVSMKYALQSSIQLDECSARWRKCNLLHFYLSPTAHERNILFGDKSFCLKMPQHIKHIKQTYLCQLLLGICKKFDHDTFPALLHGIC